MKRYKFLMYYVTMTTRIDVFMDFISKKEEPSIRLLKNREIVQWIFGDHSFLPTFDKKNQTSDVKKYKMLEDNWGRRTLKERRPDLKCDQQWTNKIGEHIGEEIYTLLGKDFSKPVKKNNHQPDLEVDDSIIEVKTQTYYTDGTAGEKIMGVPFKYRNVPILYGKPLKILCIGGAEYVCRENYGLLPGPKHDILAQEDLEYYRKKGIEFIGATDLLVSLSS